ncbi:protein-disulfide reductase DsbD family protein [Sphingomonas rubra]|nr:protein-disulfide reductase DsbD domain-containing protein [Sphingomonas rubra]
MAQLTALVRLLLLFLFTTLAPATAQAAPHLAMRLVAESSAPRAGSTVSVAIDTRPAAGWHGYWSNPGDAGFPAQLGWTLPSGMTAGTPDWPVPETLIVAGLMNYVYERPYAPIVDLRVPAGLAAGTRLPVRVKLAYLVCTREICVPEEQVLTTELVVGDGSVRPETKAAFDRWRRAIPRPLGSPATFARGDGGVLRVSIPYPADAALAEPYLFPAATGSIEPAAPQAVTRDGDRLVVQTRGAPAGPFAAVLRIGPDQGLAIRAAPGAVAGTRGGEGWAIAALVAFAGAVLGGLILNVMPCVFPILSLKALSLARSGADGPGGEREARVEALAYTGGVVAVCLALGGAILTLRAGGSAVGWAFQLQDPRMILVLLVLSVAISLNLSGLFEVPMPRFAGSGGAGGAFATGALAAFVATPCSGPFMGAALGAALVLPWPAALAVFAGLGLGLALPFLLLGFVPALRRRLPRPGAWMDRVRRVLAVPMWLTALGLAWLLGRQAGVEGMTVGLAAALVAGFALWIGGRRQRSGLGLGWTALLLLASLSGAGLVGRQAPATLPAANGEPFSEARLAALRVEGRPVFAYFTADWCLSCKVNEKAAIERASVREAWARNKVAVLVGDWTDGDPVLGRFIEAHNRAGVPLYLYYAPGASTPRVLPQVLTPGMLEALAR